MSVERPRPVHPQEARDTIEIANRWVKAPLLPHRFGEHSVLRYAILAPNDGIKIAEMIGSGLTIIMQITIEGERKTLYISPPSEFGPMESHTFRMLFGEETEHGTIIKQEKNDISIDPLLIDQIIGEGTDIVLTNHTKREPVFPVLRRLITKPTTEVAIVERIALAIADDSRSSMDAVNLHQTFQI